MDPPTHRIRRASLPDQAGALRRSGDADRLRYTGHIAELTYSTAGESHGPALTAIVTGLPSGLRIDRAFVDAQLARRQAGYGRSPRQKLEQDRADVSAGIRHGLTIGGPIAMTIVNRDHANWSAAMSVWPTDAEQGNWRDREITLPRPGHADLGGMARGDFGDLRPVLERASARETAARVAAGALAQAFLAELDIEVRAHVRSIGRAASVAPVPDRGGWAALDTSDLACLDVAAERAMVAAIDEAKAARDTLGGIVEVVAYGMPPGIGGYATAGERLDARLAAAALGVQAMKGVEFGDGFALSGISGSSAHDELLPSTDRSTQGMGVRRETNHAGGIEGGMSNGAPIVLRVAMKPLPTLMRPLASVDLANGNPTPAHAERSDVCAVAAAAVVLEAMVGFELARTLRAQFGMQAMRDVRVAFADYCARVRYPSLEPLPAGD